MKSLVVAMHIINLLILIIALTIIQFDIANSSSLCQQYKKYNNTLEGLVGNILHEAILSRRDKNFKASSAAIYIFIDYWYRRSERFECQVCTDSVTRHPVGRWHMDDFQPTLNCKLTIMAGHQYFIQINFIEFVLETITDDYAVKPCENNNHLLITNDLLTKEASELGDQIWNIYCGMLPPFSVSVPSDYITIHTAIDFQLIFYSIAIYLTHEITWVKEKTNFSYTLFAHLKV